ncbi:hypothetical protein [Streptomyces lycii]|uniref:Uncharacterized protein n=1 Tax=Streptomyces lycii TaxID=2654337 RepID=A0ABQ7FCX1_9ACTN|nr:hypothetical protein [Streptomyces lycii]KAF4406665.1 hypothetical protein GCU69_23885 [Streptomyces lycii]
MDAGTSAVLAGGIAGAVSLGGTWITYLQAKRQTKSEAQLQLREPRKRTYRDFLQTCRKTLHVLIDLQEEESHEADAGRIEHALEQHLPALQRVLAEVNLAGPEVVSKTADETVEAFNALYQDAYNWNASGGDTHDDGRPIGFGNDYTHDIRVALDRYLKEAQKALATSADG